MFANLDQIDVVVLQQETGTRLALQTDHREPTECEQSRELSVLFALARVIGPRLHDQAIGGVRYEAQHRPPQFIVEAVAAAGGQVMVDDQPVPFPGTPPAAADLADRAFRDLATTVLKRRGEELGEELLTRLEEEIVSHPPSQEEDPVGYWTCVLEVAAVCGELLRKATGGNWSDSPTRMSTVPFAFATSGGQYFNVAGKAERLVTSGMQDSLAHLLRMQEDHQGKGEQPGPLMVTFKPAQWEAIDMCVCRRLLECPAEVCAPLPWVVYGRDTPHSFVMLPKGATSDPEGADVHEQAVENLRQVAVEIEEHNEGEMRVLIVTGSYYASEKLLDVSFMRQMHERLGTPVIAAGVPRKGFLVLASATMPPPLMGQFVGLVEHQYHHGLGDSPQLCPTSIIVRDGAPAGVVTAQTAPPSPLQAGQHPFPSPPQAVGPSQHPFPSPPQAVGPGQPGYGPLPRWPGAPVSPGPLPPIAVNWSSPRLLWFSQAAAVLTEAGLLEEIVPTIEAGQRNVVLPALCKVNHERWAPYFEPSPWTPRAVKGLLETVSILRASEHREVRLQVYSPFPLPDYLFPCLQGGPIPTPPRASRLPLVVFLVIVVIALWAVAMQTSPSRRTPDSGPAQAGSSPAGNRPSPQGSPPAPLKNPTHLPASCRESLEHSLLPHGVPAECLPQEEAPPGIEGAWTSSDVYRGAPVQLKTTFSLQERVGLSVLFRSLRQQQRVRFHLRHEDNPAFVVSKDEAVEEDDTVGYLGIQLPSRTLTQAGKYTFLVELDGHIVKSVHFNVTP